MAVAQLEGREDADAAQGQACASTEQSRKMMMYDNEMNDSDDKWQYLQMAITTNVNGKTIMANNNDDQLRSVNAIGSFRVNSMSINGKQS